MPVQTRRGLLGLSALALGLAVLLAREGRAGKPEIHAVDGIALGGTDPVAYFTEGRPVPGDPAITFDWKGATWRFASAANRDAFAADPARYAPAYGGWCAWAVSRGYTAPTDPAAWRIVGGRLYLNYSLEVRARWEKDVPGNIAKADRNWPKVLE